MRPTTLPTSISRAGELPRKSLFARIGEWLTTCADASAAASDYEALRHLPDGELRRRGLARATLGLDLLRAREQSRERKASDIS